TADRPLFDWIGDKILRLGLLVAQTHLAVAQVMIHQGQLILLRDVLQVQRLDAKESLIGSLIRGGIHHELVKTLPSCRSECKHARRTVGGKARPLPILPSAPCPYRTEGRERLSHKRF